MRSAVVVATIALAFLPALPAHAVVAAAGPGGFAAGWATPVVVTQVGGPVTVANADLAPHQLVADRHFLSRARARRSRWCRSYPVRGCPVFWSRRLSIGQSAPLLGLRYVRSGRQYRFICTIHSNMKGSLRVL